MADTALEIIERELIKCAQDLISFYSSPPAGQIEIENVSATDFLEETLFCSTIGLAGDDFKLSLVIMGSQETIAALCPIPNAQTGDWVGELANQLAGRLKNGLIDYGHTGQLSLPATFSGRGLTVWDKTACPVTYLVRTEAGRIVLRLEAEVTADSVWTRSEDSSAAAEGSLCLF